jgi:hypothetical protein
MPAGVPVQVRLQREELDALDRRRCAQSNPPSRAQAILELLRVGLMNGETTRPADHADGEGRAI